MMDKPGTRSYIYCTPEAKKIAKLEVRVERLEMELKAEEEVGRRKIAELEAEIKELRSRLALEMDKKISASLNGYLIGVQGEG